MVLQIYKYGRQLQKFSSVILALLYLPVQVLTVIFDLPYPRGSFQPLFSVIHSKDELAKVEYGSNVTMPTVYLMQSTTVQAIPSLAMRQNAE